MKRIKLFFPIITLSILSLLSVSCGSRLVITSTPSAANVKVNSENFGTTPLTLDQLQSGVYKIEVSSEEYEPWTSEIELRNSQTLHAILKRKSAQQIPQSLPAPRITSSISKTSVTVFVEPEGSKVIIDGKVRGISKTGEGITVDYSAVPTLVEIDVTKPGYNRWIRSVSLESQKENRVYVKLSPVSYWFDYQTDGEFLRKTVQQVVSATSNIPTLKRTSKLAVLSITHAEGSDEPLQAVIEDALISTLAQAGFTPAERDDHLLVQLAHSTSGESLPFRVITSHSENHPFNYDAELAITNTETIRQTYPVIHRTQSTTTTRENCVEKTEENISSKEETNVSNQYQTTYSITGYVPTADQFLAYRILECGLSKTPVIEGEPKSEPMLHRYANVRIYLRVIDAKTGLITWAGYLTGESSDEIPVRVSDDLSNPPARFTSEPLPDSWQRLDYTPVRHTNRGEDIKFPEPSIR